MAYRVRTDRGFYNSGGICKTSEPTIFKTWIGAAVIALALKKQGFYGSVTIEKHDKKEVT